MISYLTHSNKVFSFQFHQQSLSNIQYNLGKPELNQSVFKFKILDSEFKTNLNPMEWHYPSDKIKIYAPDIEREDFATLDREGES